MLTVDHVDTVADCWNYTELAGRENVTSNIEYAVNNEVAYGIFDENKLAACALIHK